MLEQIEIENLGSIRKTELSLNPLTVLLGANASGKTTVMRGIELFAALRNNSLSGVRFAGQLLSGTNWPTVVHGGDPAKHIIFRARVRPDSTEPDYEMELGVNWERVSTSIVAQGETEPATPEFLKERLWDPAGQWIDAGPGPYNLRKVGVMHAVPRGDSIATTIKRLGIVPGVGDSMKDLIEFTKSFGTARYFRPNGATMIDPGLEGAVRPTGKGFVMALAALQNREIERFESLEKRLNELFPHIRRVRFDVDEEGRIGRLVFETNRSARLTPAALEADGVLTTLFLLWAGATTPPHGTLLIDDPEAALHPHLMGKRVEFLRSLANGELTGHPLRVVVATQSVDFVRWLEPSEIRVVEYSQETGTLVHPIPESETLHTLVDKFQTNAGDLWYSGAIGGVPGTGA